MAQVLSILIEANVGILIRNRNLRFFGSLGAVKVSRHRAWLSSAPVTVLALLCGVLGILQYRSIGEITAAERTIRYEALQAKLNAASQAFNQEIAAAFSALAPRRSQIEAEGQVAAYANQYSRWRTSNGHLFSRIALAIPREDKLLFMALDQHAGRFEPANWPSEWEPLHDSLIQRLRAGGGSPGPPPLGLVLDLPRFLTPVAGPPREQEWLLGELDLDYVRRAILPLLVNKYFSESGRPGYDIVVIDNRDPSQVIYETGADLQGFDADASVPLLGDVRPENPLGRRGKTPGVSERGNPPSPFGGPGRWRLLVRNREGSLETIVRQSKRRSLGVLASILALIMVTISVFVRFSRQTQRLAELQINFVAGVSHELRTPLTVIRTAAYNLRRASFRSQSDHVERYGHLIESESEKLERLVAQVLRFASAKSGHVICDREPVVPNTVIGKALESSRAAIEDSGVFLDEHIRESLPVVLADALALRHALQNLIDNALKYGTEGSKWIGIYGDAIIDEEGAAILIRVADHGPGIPADELGRLFEPFFRGRRAVHDQVHGTGLGLNLVKTIIEAHGGSIGVKSVPPRGCEFAVRIPVAPAEFQNEFAYSAD
jgi:signal transduction histidine kinase